MKFPTDTCSICCFDLSTAVPKAHIWTTGEGVTCGDCPGCGITYVMVEEEPEPVAEPPKPRSGRRRVSEPEPVAEPEPEPTPPEPEE